MRIFAWITAIAVTLSAPVAQAQSYPVTIDHKFGTTTLEEAPKRVVSLSYQNHDNLLALGVQPVAVRHWFGDFPNGVWPWADALLGEEKPVVLRGDVNIEQIAALQPDLIEAMWAGLSEEQYTLLSNIAPVVPTLAGYGDFSTPWDQIALTTGRLVGAEEEAKRQVAALRESAATYRAAHPEWEGKTATVAFYWADAPGAYTSQDMRPQILSMLGLTTPEAIDAAPSPNGYVMATSAEDISPLEADVLIWFAGGAGVEAIRDLTLRKTLTAHQQGREIYADPMVTAAFSHGSLLSLPYALEQLVPMIELAIDGDPGTEVPSSVAAQIAP